MSAMSVPSAVDAMSWPLAPTQGTLPSASATVPTMKAPCAGTPSRVTGWPTTA